MGSWINSLSGKVSIQNWRKDKEFPRQSKTDLTRKVKGTSLNRKDHNQKYKNYDKKHLTGKGKHIADVVDQTTL